jgi:hypothetical protein
MRGVLARAALTGVLLVTAACCAGEEAPPPGAAPPPARLVEPGDADRQSFGLRRTKRGKPYLFGNLALCLDRAGIANVTDVRFEKPKGDLRVEAWALRPFYRAIGSDGVGWGEPTSLQRRKVSTALQAVTQVCQPDRSSRVEFSELVVQTSRPNGTSASGAGVVVTYTSGRSRAMLRIPFGITLCAPAEKTLPLCQSQT